MTSVANTPLEQRIFTHWSKVDSTKNVSRPLWETRAGRGDLLEVRGQWATIYDNSRRSCIRYSPTKKCVPTRHLLQYFRGDEMMEFSVYDRGLSETVIQRMPLSQLIRALPAKKQSR